MRNLRRLLLAGALLLLIGGTGSAQARCATVGFDGISHTQCDLP